jgi:hypothetical protein
MPTSEDAIEALSFALVDSAVARSLSYPLPSLPRRIDSKPVRR